MSRAPLLVVAAFVAFAGGISPLDAAADSPSSVTLIRGGCMGPCEEYEVTLDELGHVKWLGLDFVNVIGEQTYDVSQRRARAVIRRALRFDHAAVEASEHLCVTDMRKARVLTREHGDASPRAFYDDHGCRSPAHRRARRLERAIDRVAKTKRYWTDGPPPCLHGNENILYDGDDDIAPRPTAVDQPYAEHRNRVLEANIERLRANPTFRIELWTFGRPSDAQQQRLDAYAAALVEAGVERERIRTAMLPGSGGSKLGEIADRMVRIAITSGTCK